MNASEYAQWYYLIYLLPGGVALLLLLLSVVGGHHHRVGGHSHGHFGHAHFGHGHVGQGPGHPTGHAHSAVLHGGGHAHGHGDTHGHGSGPREESAGAPPAVAKGSSSTPVAAPTLGQQWLAFFGLGRAPLTLLWGSALLGWGLFGFWGTQFLESHLRFPALFVLPALGIALGGALVTEKVTAEAAARLLPHDESYATSTVELCGQVGTVAYAVDEMRGRVHVYDAFGTMHDVQARVEAGRPPIARGRNVLVTDYDAARDQLVVEEIAS